jgi:hypothetical protein
MATSKKRKCEDQEDRMLTKKDEDNKARILIIIAMKKIHDEYMFNDTQLYTIRPEFLDRKFLDSTLRLIFGVVVEEGAYKEFPYDFGMMSYDECERRKDDLLHLIQLRNDPNVSKRLSLLHDLICVTMPAISMNRMNSCWTAHSLAECKDADKYTKELLAEWMESMDVQPVLPYFKLVEPLVIEACYPLVQH